ncbi:MAG: hypothetical protein GY705_29470 [Bacteroidetes bacterium]|nr:hypothetical protein [Bacteroidota bacterium]
MKSYFLVGAKILGIYLFYLCLLNLFQVIIALIVFSSNPSEPFSMPTLATSTTSLIILLILSVFLLIKTDRVASILKIQDDELDSNHKISIQSGIILIGIYIFSSRIGSLLANLYIQIKEANAGMDGLGTYPKSPIFSKDLLVASFTIIFSLFLIFGSATLVNLIKKLTKNEYNPSIATNRQKAVPPSDSLD